MPRNGHCTSCGKVRCPFITIVTRCHKRPEALQKNVRSLKAQTDTDYEQVFIFDKEGHGAVAANQALYKYRDVNCGDYVMVLNDDDFIIDKQFIEKLKIIKKVLSPDMIIWKGEYNSGKTVLPPDNACWGKRPVKNQIHSFNYCVTHELYSKYIYNYKIGNYDFINHLFHSEENPKVEWVDSIFVACKTKNIEEVTDTS